MVSRVGEWQFFGTTTPPPATGQVRLNAASQTSATRMYISKTTATSVDASSYLRSVTAGQELYIQDKDAFTKWQIYKVTEPPVEASNHLEYPVVWLRGGGIDIPVQRIFFAVDEVSTAEVLASPFAYPSTTAFGISMGMTLRQFYAAHAAQGFLAKGIVGNLIGVGADLAFRVADSMIEFEAAERAAKKAPPPLTPP
jgi:hypothetical protein